MTEVYFRRNKITYERANTLLSKLSSIKLEEPHVFAYGTTHESYTIINTLESKFKGGFKLLYSGPMLKGIWRLVPLPKPRMFSFELDDLSKIKDIFLELQLFINISFLFISREDYQKIKKLLSADFLYMEGIEKVATADFFAYSLDTDAPDVENGIAEEIVASKPVSRDILKILN